MGEASRRGTTEERAAAGRQADLEDWADAQVIEAAALLAAAERLVRLEREATSGPVLIDAPLSEAWAQRVLMLASLAAQRAVASDLLAALAPDEDDVDPTAP